MIKEKKPVRLQRNMAIVQSVLASKSIKEEADGQEDEEEAEEEDETPMTVFSALMP